jgi:hypothetical protein
VAAAGARPDDAEVLLVAVERRVEAVDRADARAAGGVGLPERGDGTAQELVVAGRLDLP